MSVMRGPAIGKWTKSIVSWRCEDCLCLSVPFTWMMERARQLAANHDGRVWVGGPAVRLLGRPAWCSPDCPGEIGDAVRLHNPDATFTTRGCPNRCEFCAVPRSEGDLVELLNWRLAPLVCDNNFLAASRLHIERAIDRLLALSYVDFNQGLDARLLTDWHADQFARLRHVKVRFALDHVNLASRVADAIGRVRARGMKDIGCYVLIGFKDTPDDAKYRLELVRSWGIRPTPMRYQPLDAAKKNDYVAPGWSAELLARMVKYYSSLRFVEHIPFEDFDYNAWCRTHRVRQGRRHDERSRTDRGGAGKADWRRASRRDTR